MNNEIKDEVKASQNNLDPDVLDNKTVQYVRVWQRKKK
jgi:hypothetical protein